MQSPKYTLNSKDVKSIVITLLIVGASAIIGQLIILVPQFNLGDNSAFYTLLLITVLKLIQKFLDGEKPTQPGQSAGGSQ